MKSGFQNAYDAWTGMLHKKRVSYRIYGLNKEHHRPIFHRFEVKEGDSAMNVMADNITKSNPLLAALQKKGK